MPSVSYALRHCGVFPLWQLLCRLLQISKEQNHVLLAALQRWCEGQHDAFQRVSPGLAAWLLTKTSLLGVVLGYSTGFGPNPSLFSSAQPFYFHKSGGKDPAPSPPEVQRRPDSVPPSRSRVKIRALKPATPVSSKS